MEDNLQPPPPGSLLLTVLRRGNSFFGVGVSCRICILLSVIHTKAVVDQFPPLGKKELIYLLLFTRSYVVSVGEVCSSSGCLGLATLFYCGTICAFHIIILADRPSHA